MSQEMSVLCPTPAEPPCHGAHPGPTLPPIPCNYLPRTTDSSLHIVPRWGHGIMGGMVTRHASPFRVVHSL